MTKLAYLLGSDGVDDKSTMRLIGKNLHGEVSVPDKEKAFEHAEELICVRHRSTDLLWAIQNNDLPGVRASLDDETINAYSPEGSTPLILAAQLGHEPVVELLLDNGAFVFARSKPYGHTALYFAQKNGSHGMIDLLLRSGAHLLSTEGTS